ncbi:hypothetical protein GIB67_026526 [Kingdonia uniflora]|uniref:Uncharacterized protein n=1 Tax=Kingdonia uniflora TaxID=39325 RepID=A0A7J7PBN9_9MAGN|nr:hypothetical protein GIB67_026526 [Kingdonia uniflora]
MPLKGTEVEMIVVSLNEQWGLEVSLDGSNSLPDGANDYIYENEYGGDFCPVGRGKNLVLSSIEYEQARKWVIDSHPHFDDWKRFMDFNTTTGNDIYGSIGRSKKKRGPSRGPASLPDGRKRNVSVNHLGQPNDVDEDMIAFVTNVGVLARTDIPIIYDDIQLVPAYFTNRILEKFEAKFMKLNHIKNGLPVLGTKSIGANEKRRYLSPIIFNIIEFKLQAMKRKLNSNALVARSEVYLTAHTQRDNTVQCPELAEKIMAIEKLEPYLKFASIDDSLAKALQKKENKGRMRGLGVGVCPIVMKKTKHLIKQNEYLRSENLQMINKVDKLEVDITKLTDTLKIFMIRSSSSSEPSVGPCQHPSPVFHRHLNKKCTLNSQKDRGVARGEVVEVDPDTLIHNVLLGDGFYKIILSKVMKPRTPLSKDDGYSEDLSDVGEGAYVAWAIWCLEKLVMLYLKEEDEKKIGDFERQVRFWRYASGSHYALYEFGSPMGLDDHSFEPDFLTRYSDRVKTEIERMVRLEFDDLKMDEEERYNTESWILDVVVHAAL